MEWQLAGKRARWPDRVANATYPAPADPPPGFASITFIGHASFMLRIEGLTILTDPVFSERCSPVSWLGPRRVRSPGLALDDLPKIDLVLLSHNHYDHMDLPSLRRIHKRFAPPIVTTLGNARTLRGLGPVQELDWWQETQLGSLGITATPSRHFARRGFRDQNRSLWAGFMLRSTTGSLLFGGDFGAGSHWSEIQQRLGAPGVALLPIGAYEPRWMMAPIHMNPQEAAQAHLDLGASRSVGMHFGTFQLTDEAIDAPVIGLQEAAAGLNDAFGVLDVGETTVLPL